MKKKIIIFFVVISFFTFFIFLFSYKDHNKKGDDKNSKLINAAQKYFENNNYTTGTYQEVSVDTLIEKNYISQSEVGEEYENAVLSISSTSDDTATTINISYVNTTSNLTIDEYTAEISTHSSNNNTDFERYIENGEEIFKINSDKSSYSRIEFKIPNVNAGDVYVFRAKVKTENMVGNRGAGLTSIYTKNGYSYSYSSNNVTDTTDWTTINIVLLPEYNYESETEADAKILVSLSIGGMTYNSEHVTGTAYFKDFELINAEDAEEALQLSDNEQLIIVESDNKKIKTVDYLEQRNNYEITDEELQNRVNLLEDVYDGYAEFVGISNKTDKLMYPYNNNQLVIIHTNHLYSGYGALANNPIQINYNSRNSFTLYKTTDNSFGFGYLHEMGHTFDHVLTSVDYKIKSSGGKWNFHSELWANMKLPYVLKHYDILVDNTPTKWNYDGLLNYLKADYINSFEKQNKYLENGLEYLIFKALTNEETGEVNWEAFKNTYRWFNDTNFEFSDNTKRIIYYIGKLNEYSNNSIKYNISEKDLNIIKNNFGLSTVSEVDIRTMNIPKNSYAIQPFKVDGNLDIMYYSSDESIAVIDEKGVVQTFDKEGTVTLTAKSVFTDDLNQSIDITISGEDDISVWNISNNSSSYVLAYYNPQTATLTIEGTGETKGYWSGTDRPWKEFEPYIKKVVIKDGVTYLNNFLFCQCTALKVVEMPDSVVTIGQFTFAETPSLQEINFSKNLSVINQRAFSESGIKSINLPESITNIGSNVFYKCYDIEEINIPNKTIEYGSLPFLASTLNIPVVFAGSSSVEIDDFDLIKRTYDSTDFLYSSTAPSFTRCTYNQDTGTISYSLTNANTGKGIISINGGILHYLNINLVPEIVPLDHIEIVSAPNKVNYINGERFNKEGMTVKAIFKNENSLYEKIVQNYTVSSSRVLKTGQTEVTINYTFNGITKTAKQKISVVDELEVTINNYSLTSTDNVNYIENINHGISLNNFLESVETNGNIEFYVDSTEINDLNKNVFTNLELRIVLGEQVETYKLIVKGDINGDSYVNTGDILKLYRYVKDTNKITEQAYIKASKINDDDLINLDDVTKLYEYILGKIDEL